jgi:hypothetical protein
MPLALYAASLAFKNFDSVIRRQLFVLESATYDLNVWQTLVQAAPLKFRIRDMRRWIVNAIRIGLPPTNHSSAWMKSTYHDRY